MAKYNKPEKPNLIWAENALEGAVVKPDDEKVRQGWVQQKPPLENENWSIQRLYKVYAYFNQLGIPEYDPETEYQAGKSYVQGSDGRVYKCRVTGTDQDPAEGGADYWEVAFLEDRFVSNFARTFLDDLDAAAGRATLELGSAATQQDNKYNHRGNNLSDVGNASTAFNNIKQNATTEKTGVVRFATHQEFLEGKNDVAVTPASIGGGGVNPPGTIITYAGTGTPQGGYLRCDGSPYSRTEYAALFAAIGTTYGAGDGSTTFNVPDTRDYFVRDLGGSRTIGSKQSDQANSIRQFQTGYQTPGLVTRSVPENGGWSGWANTGRSTPETKAIRMRKYGRETRPVNIAFPHFIKS